MAFIKFKRGEGKWETLYVEAIRNRLRRDKHLSDLIDIAAARETLGLTGDNNKTHYHDDRYLPKIDAIKNTVNNTFATSKFAINGRGTADAVSFQNGDTTTLNIKNIHADDVVIGRTTGANNMLLTSDKLGNAVPLATKKCYFDATKNAIHLPAILADSVAATKEITADTVRANRVYNAVWNDYAELFPRGEETEPGDVIALDLNSIEERYVKAGGMNPPVGVHTEEFGILIGGEQPPKGKSVLEHNIKNYIPVSLAGRVHVKFVGPSSKGSWVVPSDIRGVARIYNPKIDSRDRVIGMLVEEDDKKDIRKLKIKLKNC